MQNKNVIVTGGAGFIGSNLCKILAKKSYNPITVDNLSTGFQELVKYGDFINADIGDYEKMTAVFTKYKPLAIFHIAASKSVEESEKNPYKYYDNNVAKTNLLLKAAVDSNIKHVIFSSTAAVYGMPNHQEKYITENSPTKPINTYGISKLMAEKILASYDKSHGLKYSALRYFNVTAADPELELGEMVTNPANIFPILIQTIDKKREQFTVFGDDYNTKDGTCIRDYIHVWDLVNAHVAALEKQLQTNNSVTINLGNGVGFSVQEVIKTFQDLTKTDFKIIIGNRRIGDPDLVMADIKFANEYLGWQPKYTNLQDHAKHAWQWYQKLKNA